VVSPDGATVFVTGASSGGRLDRDDFETVAYSAVTGKQLWVSSYSGPGKLYDDPAAIAVSPGGGEVFVTGDSGRGNSYGYATVAYNAATGRQLWARRYTRPVIGIGSAFAVAVSPGGGRVFVTGFSPTPYGSRATGQSSDYATLAYNAGTGRQLWASRYSGPVHGPDQAESVAVSPGGHAVFVTGNVQGHQTPGHDYETVAYNAADGRQLWASWYHATGHGLSGALAVAVNPHGRTVYVTGAAGDDFGTVAYSAVTGRQLWASRYHNGLAISMALRPDGTAVYVTGDRYPSYSYETVAYDAATGRQLWARGYHGYEAQSVAVSPDGATVYVTGGSLTADYATVAYNATTGTRLWTSIYHGNANDGGATGVAVNPAGTTVFVTGAAQTRTADDYVTIAYRS
jgi:outer membrane protein assembly factor BamB